LTPRQGAVRVDHVYKIFHTREGTVHAVTDCTLDARPGEFVSILGPSGCGKSTLLLMIAGLTEPSQGVLEVGGGAVQGPTPGIGIAFQSSVLLPWRTAIDNVMLPLEVARGDAKRNRDKATTLLASVGLAGFESRFPSELSGGMRQRVALCRALVADPRLLLMDEPFAALDALTRDQLVLDLQQLWLRQKPTVVFVTHSLEEAVFLSDRIYVMTPRPGRVDQVIEVELPRPRKLSMRGDAAFTRYTRRIRELFLARGILSEGGDDRRDGVG
jgi:NitT/TauT family transport system ATP-binding protein